MRNHAAERDPSRNPNFARRWTEPLPCEGFKTIGETSAKIVAHLPFQRKIERFHHLGPRALGEFLAETLDHDNHRPEARHLHRA